MRITVVASLFPRAYYAATCCAHLALQFSTRMPAKTWTMWMQVSIMAAIRHPNVGTSAYVYCLCRAYAMLMLSLCTMPYVTPMQVAMLMGLCLSPIGVVTEFCTRGSLTDVLRKAASDMMFAQQLDWRKRITMALDAAKVKLDIMGNWAVCRTFRLHEPSVKQKMISG